MEEQKVIRPTKKQKELLGFIDAFIAEHGYSPSYREIMNGLQYTSVATVALHVNNLIKRGHLRKRDRSARSLEVVKSAVVATDETTEVTEAQEKWLVKQVDARFATVEAGETDPKQIDQLYVLVGALKVLGLDEAANSFIARLSTISKE